MIDYIASARWHHCSFLCKNTLGSYSTIFF